MRQTKTTLKKIFTIFVGCLSLFFAGMASAHSALVNQEVTYKCVAKQSASNDYGYVYATICYGEGGSKQATAAFQSNYGSNFSSKSQYVPVALNPETNEMKTFKAGLSEDAMGDVHVGNLINYTNQKELRRFETAWINVYDNNLFSPSIAQMNVDGFVFLPDFYADELIANSNGKYLYYKDMLPSPNSNGALTDFQFLTIQSGDVTRKWVIGGIYHAKGFNETYLGEKFEYNDGNFGEGINFFGAPFLIAYDSTMMSNFLNGIAVLSVTRQYSLEQRMKSLVAYDKDKTGSLSFFSIKNGDVKKMDGYSMISTADLCKSDISVLYYIFITLAIASTIVFYFLVKSLPYKKSLPFLGLTAAGPFVLSLLGSLFANNFGIKNLFLCSFFSYYFGVFALIVLGIAFGHFINKAKKKHEVQNEA